MDRKAENVVQNIGVIAETTSIFYNSIIKQVPKDVALILTQHFMDITISRKPGIPVSKELAAAIAAAQAAEAKRRAAQQRTQAEQKTDSSAEGQENSEEKTEESENQ